MINLEAKQKTSYCECMNVMSLRGRRQFKSVILLVCKSGVELFFSIFGGMGDLTIGQSFFYSVGAMSSFLVKDQFFGSAPLLLCGGFDFKEKKGYLSIYAFAHDIAIKVLSHTTFWTYFKTICKPFFDRILIDQLNNVPLWAARPFCCYCWLLSCRL